MLDFDRTGIDQFVSLGSPQLAPPDGVIDQVGRWVGVGTGQHSCACMHAGRQASWQRGRQAA